MRIVPLIAVLTLLSGCRFFDRQPQAADGATITLEQFGQLQWLSGRWVGTGSDSSTFRESYLFLDDSTIKSVTWADTSFTQVGDSSFLTLRGGQVTSGGGDHRWVLTRWDRFGLHFDPRGKAGNSFVWRPIDAYTWIATLSWTDAQGAKKERVYTMRRYQL
jgi:hypothetical protein